MKNRRIRKSHAAKRHVSEVMSAAKYTTIASPRKQSRLETVEEFLKRGGKIKTIEAKELDPSDLTFNGQARATPDRSQR